MDDAIDNVPGAEEPNLQRLCRLHEAGHAIVAVDYGLTIGKVFCDGAVGDCEIDLTTEARNESDYWHTIHRKAPSVTTFEHIVDVSFPWLVGLMGGIAGESLMHGRAVLTTRRASDDLVSFYGFLAIISRDLPVSQTDPLWLDTFLRAQDEAWRVVKARRDDVEKVAARLGAKEELSGDEILQLTK